jgi:hypothetical protein
MSIVRVTVFAVLAWVSSGCAALREPNEVAWQAMHVVDTLQTLQISRDSRYREAESAWLMGERPDETTVLAWSVGTALAHAGVTQLLLEYDYPKLAKVWQFVTLNALCHTVEHNASIGIRIGQSNTGYSPPWRPFTFPSGDSIDLGYR